MDNKRKDNIRQIIAQLNDIKNKLNEYYNEEKQIWNALDYEQQDTEYGSELEYAIGSLCEAAENIDDIVYSLDENIIKCTFDKQSLIELEEEREEERRLEQEELEEELRREQEELEEIHRERMRLLNEERRNSPLFSFGFFSSKKASERKSDIETFRSVASSDRFRAKGSGNWTDREDWATDNSSRPDGFDIYEDNDY